jgi:diguanylate cyclase (GGDEF)-like protein
LLESEKRVFERIALGREHATVLEEIARLWESHSRHYPHCAVMVADETGRTLELATAPSLPAAFHELRRRTPVAADANPCGHAAWSKQPIVVEDVTADPRCQPDSGGLLEIGLRAGWAQPILSSRGRLLGIFAVYSAVPALPDAADEALMQRLVHIACIAMEKHRTERALEHMAHYDALTGLPNRSLLLDRLDGALLRGAKSHSATALLLFNLDGMKQINDTYGYEFGDRCIKTLAARVRAELPRHQTLGRVGGDEFGVVLEEVSDEDMLPGVVQALLENITQGLRIDERDVFMSASLGISIGSRDGLDADTLFKNADAALHRAKQQGRNGFQFFTSDMNASAARRLGLLGDLRHALERGEFHVEYQPQVSLADGHIVGAEALLRWHHGEHGLVPPAEFIPLLEETGLIIPVGEWTLERVCGDVAEIRRQGIQPPQVSVNLSVRQFREQDLASRIERILGETGVPPDRLTLEITESLLMRDPAETVRILHRLKEIHVTIALDDFGTGYSSLSYLKRFPIDELKVDKSFVDGVMHSVADAAITDAVIHLAHSLGMSVVAEGVERQEQLEYLKQQGCDRVQGFLTGRPVDIATFRHLLSHATDDAGWAQDPSRQENQPGESLVR